MSSKARPLGQDPKTSSITSMPTSGTGTRGFSFEAVIGKDALLPAEQASEKVQNQNIDTASPAPSGEVLLALSDIDPPTISQRQAYPREMVDRMAAAIRRMAEGKPSILDGQIHPIVVAPKPGVPGQYIIIDGFTRYQAFKTHYLSGNIKATIRSDVTEADMFAMAFSANVDRNSTTDFDRGMALAEALRVGIYSNNKEISERLDVDPKVVTGLIAYSKLPDAVVEQVRQAPENFTYNVASRILALANKEAPHDLLMSVAKKVRDGAMTFARLNKMVTDYEGEAKTNKRQRRDTRSIMGYGKVKATDDAVVLDLASLPMNLGPKLADSLQEFVLAFLKSNIPSENIPPSEDE